MTVRKKAIFYAITINSILFFFLPTLYIIFQTSLNIKQTEKKSVEFNIVSFEKEKKQNIRKIKSLKSSTINSKPVSLNSENLKLDLSIVGAINKETFGTTNNIENPVSYLPGTTDIDASLIPNGYEIKTPSKAEREQINGIVVLQWIVNESGQVEQIEILQEQPTGYQFAKNSISYLKKCRFKPAEINQTPVKQKLKQLFRFNVY